MLSHVGVEYERYATSREPRHRIEAPIFSQLLMKGAADFCQAPTVCVTFDTELSSPLRQVTSLAPRRILPIPPFQNQYEAQTALLPT